MKRTRRKPRRKQPRRMTPPLVLRDVDNGDRSIIELDDETKLVSTQRTGRLTAYLTLSPGLAIKVRSICANKRRFTHLAISPIPTVP